MKATALAVMAFLALLTDPASANASKVSPAVSFDGKVFHKANEQTHNGATLVEYLPKGESLDSWKHLAALRAFPGVNDPKRLAFSMIKSLRASNPGAQTAVTEHPRTKEVILDFITWPENGDFVEFNIFRISRLGRDGVLLQQYARRAYGKDANPFLESIKTERARLVNLMAKTGLKRMNK